MNDKRAESLSVRERITVILVMFLVQLIAPYQYEHQFKPIFDDIKELMK